MASTLVQFRTDEATRNQATSICEQLGIDLPTYMRICITRLVQEKGIPFSMRIGEDDSATAAFKAMREASRIAEKNGIADMTLDEINAEIAEARKSRK
ncbi:MAG: type II toxin-antitoxin system RelB/DinJ family antitoxin [Oscillospiraceae bacterium]|nr:type II toxin-antitoxin system RelB/DinJ family antitoxin [Oscillospiraceae bacterium]